MKTLRNGIIVTLALAGALLARSGTLVETVRAGTANIDPVHRWAWNDIIGWIDLGTGTVEVTKQKVTGYANSSVGYVSFDCSSGIPGANCSIQYGVTNDGQGGLAGWAWNDGIGWISFSCTNPETGGSCATSQYQVRIDADGYFYGYAWNDVVGWISFNCSNTGSCGTVDYKVRTSWKSGPVTGELTSNTFDTGVSTGVAYNYFLWDGELNGGAVKFQLATANCENGATNPPNCTANSSWGGNKTSGDGAFLGPDGTTTTFYAPGPGVAAPIAQAAHNDRRYFRYRVVLESSDGINSPVVRDIVVNWAP